MYVYFGVKNNAFKQVSIVKLIILDFFRWYSQIFLFQILLRNLILFCG